MATVIGPSPGQLSAWPKPFALRSTQLPPRNHVGLVASFWNPSLLVHHYLMYTTGGAQAIKLRIGTFEILIYAKIILTAVYSTCTAVLYCSTEAR